jgi:hypothetical protein
MMDITLGESLLTIYKGKEIFGKKIPAVKIDIVFIILNQGILLDLFDLDINGWRIFNKLRTPEMRRCTLVALLCSYEANTIIINDPELSKHANCIWL